MFPGLSASFTGGSAGPSQADSQFAPTFFQDGTFAVGGTGNTLSNSPTATSLPSKGLPFLGGLNGSGGSSISPLLLIGAGLLLLLVLRRG